jgi:hypothetical protein
MTTPLKMMQYVIIGILVLCAVASIRNVSAGFEEMLNASAPIIFLMSLFLFALQFAASAASFTQYDLPWPLRGLAIFIALGALFVATRLSVVGFEAGERQMYANAVERNPAVVSARRELERLIQRGNLYVLTKEERVALAASERDQRKHIHQLETQLRFEGRGQSSNVSAVLGAEAESFRWAMAFAPEVALLFLAPLLMFLMGKIGETEQKIMARAAQESAEQLVRLSPPDVTQQVKPGQPASAVPQRTNGREVLQDAPYDPFAV